MSLKDKTVSGLTWSFIDNFAKHGVQFIFGIILARLLTPREFGLIGMTTFFVAFLQPFVISGLPHALIRKSKCTQEDYSTVFYYNFVVSIVVYAILFLSAGVISNFFDEPKLKLIIRVSSLGIIISSVSIVQGVILSKRIDFKLLTKISIISALGAGIIGVVMAYRGFGVWSLVAKHLMIALITTLLLWIWNKWRPSLVFSWQSFKEMFSFGSKLLASSLLDTIHRHIYLLVIGKYFSAEELGYYTRATQFKKLPSENITRVVQRVSYPVLASIQEDIPRLKASYQKLIRSTMFITFVSMIGMAAVAKPMVLTLIGEQWLPSVIYLQLLCFVGMSYPLQAINLNMLQVQGRSDLFLKLEIIKKLLVIPTIFVGIFLGIKIMIGLMFFNTLIAFFINSKWSGKFIGYSSLDQLKDIFPSFLVAISMGLPVFMAGQFLRTSPLVTLTFQILLGAVLTLGLTEIFRMKDYLLIKTIVMEKIFKKFGKDNEKRY
ncbi:MAG: lipopolysaccharide biosynthesis protein [Candidatus Cloacimonetes bacterium]|nr:lipopolysaccharide biosynthesis protein [Candidatus Cloacimonadota bacterium]